MLYLIIKIVEGFGQNHCCFLMLTDPHMPANEQPTTKFYKGHYCKVVAKHLILSQ